MEWDQKLFHKFYHFFKKHEPTEQELEREKQAYDLESVQDRLEILIKLLTGLSIKIHRAESAGGIRKGAFFLPEKCDFFESSAQNLDFYIFRICFLTSQWKWQSQFQGTFIRPNSRSFTEDFVRFLLERMYVDLPSTQSRFEALFKEAEALRPREEEIGSKELAEEQPSKSRQELHDLLFGTSSTNSNKDIDSYIHSDYTPDRAEEDEEKALTEHKAPAKEETESLVVDQKTIEDYTLMHQFEKVETLDEFRGRWRTTDGEDDLDEHLEALQELNVSQTVRSDSPTHSVYQADFLANTSIPEAEESENQIYHHLYPEWDYKKRVYKPDYCKVFLQEYDWHAPEYVKRVMQDRHSTLQDMRRKLARLHHEREQKRKQVQGEHPDIDAIIENVANLKAGITPDDRVYLSSRLQRREHAVLILIDISLSTDAYSENQRILDVEKEAVLLFGQLLHENSELFQVDAFCSRTRNYCQYMSLKKFSDNWAQKAPSIAGIQPIGYTRIGPALRHATYALTKQKARKKWILFLSDGKPNDYDRYEGNYGIHDVRQAIREAHQLGISTYALAVDKQAQYSLPQIFGTANYKLLPHPNQLPEALLYFYTQLLSKR